MVECFWRQYCGVTMQPPELPLRWKIFDQAGDNMNKVMVIEASEVFRDKIITMVNWADYGCQIIGEASDGTRGIQLFSSVSPNIVILDTVLPGIEGLEVIRIMKELKPDIQVIVITSERMFAHIKRAMEYGVQAWILKSELNSAVLAEQLNRAKDQILSQRKLDYYTISSGMRLFLTQGRRSAIVSDVLKRQQIQMLCAPAIQQTSLEYMDDFEYWLELNEYFHNYSDVMSVVFSDIYGMRNMILLPAEDLHSLQSIQEYCMAFAQSFQKYHRDKYNFDLHIAIGGLSIDEKQFYDIYLRSSFLLMDGVFNQGPAIIEAQIKTADVMAHETAQHYLQQMMELVRERRYEEAKTPAEALMNHLKQVRFPPLFQEIMLSAEKFLGDYAKQGGLVYPYNTINQASDALIATLDNMEREQSSKYSGHVRRMLQYIHKNYQTDINLKMLAEEVGISQVYAGQIFKKETGKTVSQYITECRINKAARLLESGSYKVYEVSEMVGYTSVPYFNRVFRNYTGKTPRETV